MSRPKPIEWAVDGDEVHVRGLRNDEIGMLMSFVGMLQRRRWGEECRAATDDQLDGAATLPVSREDGQ